MTVCIHFLHESPQQEYNRDLGVSVRDEASLLNNRCRRGPACTSAPCLLLNLKHPMWGHSTMITLTLPHLLQVETQREVPPRGVRENSFHFIHQEI